MSVLVLLPVTARDEPTAQPPGEDTGAASLSTGPAASRPELGELAGAVNEAAANCQALADAPTPGSLARLDFDRGLAAMLENSLVHRVSYGELPQLVRSLRFLKAFAAAGARGPKLWRAMLAEQSMTLDDVRFLGGFVHWYLSGAFAAAVGEGRVTFRVEPHPEHRQLHDARGLARFRGKDFGQLLAEMD